MDNLIYHLTYNYSGHAEPMGSFRTLEEGIEEFNLVLSKWKLEPQDQSLELWDEVSGDTHKEYIFNEGNWESDE